MARLYTCGFELNTLADGFERFGTANSGSISSSVFNSGAYSYRNNPSASIQSCNFLLNAGAGIKTVYGRFYYRVTTQPASNSLVFSLTQSDLTTILFRLRGTGSGLRVMNSPNTQVGSDFALSTGQWYLIEFYCFSNASTGAIEVKVDGVSVVNVTGTNTGGGDIGGFIFGSGFSLTHEYHIDDVAINDTSASDQNSWPGAGKVICIRPNAAGDFNQFTRGGSDSGANWSQCDEVTPNDATDYNVSGTLNNTDLFNCAPSGINSYDTVNVVHVGDRFSNIVADGTAQHYVLAEKTSSGTVATGAVVGSLNSTTWRSNGLSTTAFNPYGLTMYRDPDGSAWTQSTLDSMQIGYQITTGGSNGIAVSTVWAMVDYTPGTPPTGGSPTNKFLLGVG